MAASMLVASVGTGFASDDFADVPDDHTFHDEISWLADSGITRGWQDSEDFHPARGVTRQAYMAFLYRMAGEPQWAGCDATQFSDVSEDHPFCEEITWGAAMDVTEGYPDGTFKPGRDVTRQAAAAFQYRAVGSPDHSYAATFTDVPPGHTFYHEIAWMDGEGIAEGYPDGRYLPGVDVTRQAAAAFLFRMDAKGWTVLAGQAPAGDAAALDLTPQEATNAFDTDHTSTATLTDADGNNVDGTVRFEVYRDANGDNNAQVATGEVVETTNGTAEFTYNGPSTENDDYIVACEVENAATPCVQGDEIEVDPVTGEPRTAPDQEPNDTAVKHWVSARNAVASFDVTPESDQNVVGSDHTVTATITDDSGEGIEGLTDVTFDVFRDTDGDGAYDSQEVTGAAATETGGGEYEFTYTGPGDPADDVIVGCIDDDTDACATLENDGTVTTDADDEFNDTVTKSWVGAEYTVELTPQSDVNMAGTDHTVTATVTDQFGDRVDNQQVLFEVYRDTPSLNEATSGTDTTGPDDPNTDPNEAGQAEFTYTGPPNDANDTIVACIDENTNNQCAQIVFGEVVTDPNEPNDTAQKEWREADEAQSGAYAGDVESIAAGTNDLFVEVADGDWREFDYQDDDRFFVDGQQVTVGDFEAAASEGDPIEIDYNTFAGEQSTFSLQDADA